MTNNLEAYGPGLLLSPGQIQTAVEKRALATCVPVKIRLGTFFRKIKKTGSKSLVKIPGSSDFKNLPLLYREITSDNWTPLSGQSFSQDTISACLPEYGAYQVYVPILNQPYVFGEVYVFPNPAHLGQIPMVHIEVGMSDRVSMRIYDVAGDLVYETRITDMPQAVRGKSAYEHSLDIARFKSGVYVGVITAEKSGKETLRKTFRFSILK